MNILQGCHKVVTRLSQGCDKVARTPQPCHHLVISVWVQFLHSGHHFIHCTSCRIAVTYLASFQAFIRFCDGVI